MSVVEQNILTPNRDARTKTISYVRKKTFKDLKSQCNNSSTTNPYDIKHVCRICLLAEHSLISLMSTVGRDVLANIYSSVTSFEVVPEENLPMSICSPCHENLINCYSFKNKCIESYNLLQSTIDINSKKDSRIVGKKDKETQTCVNDYDVEKWKIEEKNKILETELNVDVERETNCVHAEIEYLEEDLLLIDNLKNTTDVIHNGFIEDKKNIYRKKPQFSCHKCSKNFLKLKTLRVHTKECSENVKREFSCSQCKQSFNSEYDLKIHSAIHVKGNKWKCLECKKEFTERSRFRRHIRRHMDTTKRWSCSSCGKAFTEQSALRRHVRVHTGEAKEKKYHCQLCDKKFGDANQLKEHNAKHTGVRPCTCEVCGKTFASSRLLSSHRRVHSEHRPYKCAHCDRRFREKSTLNTHTRTHTGERPYVCSVCGKAFIQSSNLSLHMRTHTGEKPYACKVCERKFSAGSTLACHMRIHTGEKPYCCSYCGKRFARTDIKAHVRLHTGERPYACFACPKAFVSASALREHRRAHTGEKPFQCTLCPEKYKKKILLMNHLKVHAKEKKIRSEDIKQDQEVPYVIDVYTKEEAITINNVLCNESDVKTNSYTLNADEIPLEVSGELIVQDEGDVKTELVVFSDDQNTMNYQNNSDICLINNVTPENEINLSESIHDGTTMKLYRLDESLLQIQATGRQLTIRKITSKMTTNF